MNCNYQIVKVPKGSDVDFTITVADNAGVNVDCSVFDKVYVFVYSQDKTLLKKYALITEAGYSDLINGGTGNSELTLRLLSEDTNLADDSILLYELRLMTNDITSTDDSIFDVMVTDQYLCTIIESVSGPLI